MPIWVKKVEDYKTEKDIITFGDVEIEKKNYRCKTPIVLKDVDIEKVLVSNKISFGEKHYKYFIDYLYKDDKVKQLHIMLHNTNACVKSYDEQSKWICFLIEGNELLEKYKTFWDKISADIKKNWQQTYL